MKKVTRSSQMKVKMSSAGTKAPGANVNKAPKVKRQTKDPLAGKTGGTGLDDYNLDVMQLD